VDPYSGILRSIWDAGVEVQDPTTVKAFANETIQIKFEELGEHQEAHDSAHGPT
jgi:hypothetical protein